MNNTYFVGMPVSALPTPALTVDVDIMQRNMEVMAERLAKTNTQLRPHAKTHKTPAIGHLQMRAGAVGLCCATVGEAEVMVYSGIPEVMIANEIVDPVSLRRAVNLARQARLLMIVDDCAVICISLTGAMAANCCGDSSSMRAVTVSARRCKPPPCTCCCGK